MQDHKAENSDLAIARETEMRCGNSLLSNLRRATLGIFCLFVILGLLSRWNAFATSEWQALSPGMELKYLPVTQPNAPAGANLTVLRIDPHLWEMELIGTSRTGEKAGHTAREWCETHKLTAAINAGMFKTDGATHVGFMRFQEHVNNAKANSYQSVAAFDPRDPQALAPFRIFDLDSPGVTLQTILKDYNSAVQNLRLIKRPGSNQWAEQDKKWSEAALGEDSSGRVLFLFSRYPFSMHDLNQELLSAGIGLVAAQHLEGGPEAQLYLRLGEKQMELFGSYETSFVENDSNAKPWPIPNVLGVRPRSSETH
jgi:Phosphodiester glycosidase